MLEAAEEDIEFAQQRFVIKGTDRGMGLFEIDGAASGDGIPGDLRGPLTGISDETMNIPSYAYTCAVCEVEVDPETGLVEVVRYTSIDDCGRAVNPMLIHGQSHGGIAQGIGQALWEACVYDPRSGQLLSGSLLDYAIPRADLLPAGFRDGDQRGSVDDEPARDARRQRGRDNPWAGCGGERDCRRARGVRRRAYRAAGNPSASGMQPARAARDRTAEGVSQSVVGEGCEPVFADSNFASATRSHRRQRDLGVTPPDPGGE
jgi:hypothetical protein